MGENAMKRLNDLILEKDSRICAGLDPDWNEILKLNKCKDTSYQPELLKKYCTDYIDVICDIVPAIKMNIGHFIRLWAWGVYREVAVYAKRKGLFVIGDVKVGDIGATSEAYADGYLGKDSPFDAITVNGYFGSDGVMPFLKLAKENGKGVFLLVKTSNKTSAELQDVTTTILDAKTHKNKCVYEKAADLVAGWGKEMEPEENDYYMVGAVIGATYSEQLKELAEKMNKTFLLVPGYGKQGATADDVAVAFDGEGKGAIVNSSRDIMKAYAKDCWKDTYSESTWMHAARAEAIRATKEINMAIEMCMSIH